MHVTVNINLPHFSCKKKLPLFSINFNFCTFYLVFPFLVMTFSFLVLMPSFGKCKVGFFFWVYICKNGLLCMSDNLMFCFFGIFGLSCSSGSSLVSESEHLTCIEQKKNNLIFPCNRSGRPFICLNFLMEFLIDV